VDDVVFFNNGPYCGVALLQQYHNCLAAMCVWPNTVIVQYWMHPVLDDGGCQD